MAPTDAVIAAACSSELHQSFSLPATATHPTLRITYSTVGFNVDNTALSSGAPTLLLIGGMFGGRYMAQYLHHLALRIGVRVIVIDRPGLGGSTSVPITQRVSVWLETVPALLAHLNVQHVALASHSAGTIYCLNTILHAQGFLHPQRPYIALLAPWVHYDHSGNKLMKVTGRIPTGIMSGWSNVAGFVARNVIPTATWCSGHLKRIASRGDSAIDPELRQDIEDAYGRPYEEAIELENLVDKYRLTEDIHGGSDEAMLCLKKFGTGLWGSCEDYAAYTVLLKSKLSQASLETHEHQAKTKIQTFFAESDVLCGKKGQAYFESCWHDAEFGSLLDFESFIVPETNHDSVCSLTIGVMERVLQETKDSFRSS